MNNTKHDLLKIMMLSMAIIFTYSAQAQPERYIEGTHYIIIEGATIRDFDSTAVMEIFSYGCPACYAFDPILNAWKQTNSSDMNFIRSPVVWNQITKQHAQLYFVAEALGITEEVHEKIFDEIHQKGNHLLDQPSTKKFFMSVGIDGADFDQTYKSFSVNSALRKAESLQKGLDLTGIPSMLVGGKYLIINDSVSSYQEVLEVVSYLLKKGRS